MTTSQDPDEYFLPHAEQLRSDLAVSKEPVSYRQYKEIITNGISDVHPDVLFTILRDPGCSNGDIHRTVSEIHQKDTRRLIWKTHDRRARHRFSGLKWQKSPLPLQRNKSHRPQLPRPQATSGQQGASASQLSPCC